MDQYIFLSVISGPRAGTNFLVDSTEVLRIGRGTDCNIVLSDPLCSRVHAQVVADRDGWFVRDQESRNGTFVNNQKIDEARLVDGSHLRLGTTEFTFHISEEPPSICSAGSDVNITQTIIRDRDILPTETANLFEVTDLPDAAQTENLLMLYQLSVKLLGCDAPDDVVNTALELLRGRTRASVVGFLWVTDTSELKPKLVIPQEAAEQVALSESLTTVVLKQKKAVWVENQQGVAEAHSLRHFADAICVPLVLEGETLGAIHLYMENDNFRQEDLDFAISLANILVVALVRARQQASLVAERDRLVISSANFDELLGESPPMLELKSKISRIARATGCVLVRGESGTGKELVARALHKSSNRSDRPMLSVNCAAIPRDLMESQLFGHKRGAFTSAEADHTGWFQQADTGTLFLDEVGEMTLEGQAKLLRILEGHPFLPVGGTEEITVDVRIIAATNRDLRDFVRDGRFREDLYYRMSVFELYIPPLRERGRDIGLLLDFFFEHFRHSHGRPELQISEAAREKLLGYDWPGNVRQLRNVIDSAVVMAEGDQILPDDLGLRDTAAGELETLRIDDWERKLIREAIKRTGGSVPEAAKLLGIGRATLYRKIDDYGIKR